MDRAIIFLLCCMTTLCFSQRSEYLEFVKDDILMVPTETLDNLINSPISSHYKPANRAQLTDNREKHLQLSINLFRKQQYSLLLKSMQSFERTYGSKKDSGLHQYFQMVILENKLSKQTNVHNQIISLANKGVAEHSENDLNLKFAFQKTLMKYYYLSKKWDLLNREVAKFKDYSQRINSDQETTWSVQVETEIKLARGITPQNLESLNIPEVMKADYIVYDSLLKNAYEELANRYLNEKWHNSSQSLLNNLIFTALITNKDDRARVFISQLAINLEKSNSHIEFYTMILNKAFYKGFENSKFKIVSKLIELEDKQSVLFDEQEHKIMPESLKKYIWKSRIEHFALSKQGSEYLKYLSAIPFYRLSLDEINLLLKTNKKYLQSLYSDLYFEKKYNQLINHWETINTKSSVESYIGEEIKFLISASYIQLKKYPLYYQLVRGDSARLINDLEALKAYINQDWLEVAKYAADSDRLEVLALGALSYVELNQRVKAEALFQQVLSKNADIKGEIKQDFFIGYIRLITSSNKAPEYVYRRLNRIKSGIKHLGVTSNRVNEVIEAHLIGLNMTLKKTSFENLLTSVKMFLKNYPRSQFYSMINLTRAKILAQLSKIEESMEALQNLVKNTNDEKIKIEALDELTILKNK